MRAGDCVCPALLLAQAAHDVLHVDDGVVDDQPSAITRPASTMVLIVAPIQRQHHPRGHQRERDGDHADEGDAPLVEEGDEDHDDQRRSR